MDVEVVVLLPFVRCSGDPIIIYIFNAHFQCISAIKNVLFLRVFIAVDVVVVVFASNLFLVWHSK